MKSLFFLQRFLRQPLRVASVIPSSPALIGRVCQKFDFSRPRTIVEFGPGEGCHTRAIRRRMHPGSRLILLELDPQLAALLRQQFAGDPRIAVLNADAGLLPAALAELGVDHCDYILSGIPFSILPLDRKREILRRTFDALAPGPTSAFIVYQVTNELRQHATLFPRVESEYCLLNIPPMFITAYFKEVGPTNGRGRPAAVASAATPAAERISGNGEH